MISLINSLLPALCLCVGFYFGKKDKGKEIEIPEKIKHPCKHIKGKIKAKKETKQIQEQLNYLNDVLYNIENYDGTGKGQKTIEKR